MPKPITGLRIRIGFTAFVAVISLSAKAYDQEIRIGRYQTIRVDAPPQKIEAAPSPQPIVLPDDLTTRGEALEWILQHHGYQLHREARELLSAAKLLAASLPAEDRGPSVVPLRMMLEALLGPRAEVLVDSEIRQVSVSFGAQVAGGFDEVARSE